MTSHIYNKPRKKKLGSYRAHNTIQNVCENYYLISVGDYTLCKIGRDTSSVVIRFTVGSLRISSLPGGEYVRSPRVYPKEKGCCCAMMRAPRNGGSKQQTNKQTDTNVNSTIHSANAMTDIHFLFLTV